MKRHKASDLSFYLALLIVITGAVIAIACMLINYNNVDRSDFDAAMNNTNKKNVIKLPLGSDAKDGQMSENEDIPSSGIMIVPDDQTVYGVESQDQPQFKLGAFSSEHRSSNDGVSSDSYFASNVLDGDIHTAWIPVCEDDGLSPVGHWIELSADSPQSVSGIDIANGFSKDSRKYNNNYRVKDIRIIINGTETINAVLHDLGCGTKEYVAFPKIYKATSIRVVIDSVYETGSKYKEAAISEIEPVLK